MKYCKKPVVIDATQFQPNYNRLVLGRRIRRWDAELKEMNRVAEELVTTYDNFSISQMVSRETSSVSIRTMEGTLKLKPGNWVIKGVKGEVYPCDDEIFKMTYEPVDT